ncbi:MAG TPA: PilZ domain-containing protein [Nitrospira sp.]|nr:PilZ domain-containing protein [Nitrospira sp.]
MKNLHCPSCGTPFVRATYNEGTVEKMLGRFNVHPFRCQLCTRRFHAFWTKLPDATHSVDRRQYKRLPVSLHAEAFADTSHRVRGRITDISVDGCTVETPELLPLGTFMELTITPASDEAAIKVETAAVCSVRKESMGIHFLELPSGDKYRLSQVILSLLVGQSVHPNLFS